MAPASRFYTRVIPERPDAAAGPPVAACQRPRYRWCALHPENAILAIMLMTSLLRQLLGDFHAEEDAKYAS